MNWVDYTITQAGPHFTIKGEWAGEVMGWSKEGKPDTKASIIIFPAASSLAGCISKSADFINDATSFLGPKKWTLIDTEA